MKTFSKDEVLSMAEHLDKGTPNWYRETFGDWKDSVHICDRAPKDAADMLRAFAHTLGEPVAVPDAMTKPSRSAVKSFDEAYGNGVADGWNACRDAMLAAPHHPTAGKECE